MSVKMDHEIRLQALVKAKVGGSLQLYHQTEADTHETAYIVLWSNDRECGTHRACLANESDDAMLVWGHFFPGPNGLAAGITDFFARVR